jgi:hypothetical protein
MKLAKMTMIGLLGVVLAAPVLAQPGPGMGGGGMQGAGPGSGMGMGPGGGRGMRFNKDNTTGWSLMSAEERNAHRSRMMSAKSYDECKAMQEEQHKSMEARAKDKGMTLPAPRQNGCDRMKARGMFK